MSIVAAALQRFAALKRSEVPSEPCVCRNGFGCVRRDVYLEDAGAELRLVYAGEITL
jgi:hypothetical protein